jgi:hypothetical protein
MFIDLKCQAHDTKVGREIAVVVAVGVVLNARGEGGDDVRVERFLDRVQKSSTLCFILRDHTLPGLKAVVEGERVCKFKDIPVEPSRHEDLKSGIKPWDREG